MRDWEPVSGKVDCIWAQAFPYLLQEEKEKIREGWKGSLVYIASAKQLRRAILPHLTMTLVGVKTEPGTVAVAIGALAAQRAKQVLGEPIGYL